MDYISLLLLMAFGGSCGGFASGIAQNNENNSYEVRVPFLRTKNNGARLVPLGILGNMIIGATASISIFFIAVPLFNLKFQQLLLLTSHNGHLLRIRLSYSHFPLLLVLLELI